MTNTKCCYTIIYLSLIHILTWEVRDGILCHTCGTQARTLEGRVVRLEDRIAYINHDIDDAKRAGVLCEDESPADILHVLGSTKSKRIDTLVLSAVTNSTGEEIRLDPEIQQAFDRLHDFMYESVYLNPRAKKEEKKVPGLIETLYRYLCRPDRLPEDMRRIAQEEGCERAACD